MADVPQPWGSTMEERVAAYGDAVELRGGVRRAVFLDSGGQLSSLVVDGVGLSSARTDDHLGGQQGDDHRGGIRGIERE